MRLAVWQTQHEISRTVSRNLADALGATLCDIENLDRDLSGFDAHLAYGILRGTPELFKRVEHWFEIDKGFWDAEHYTGLYRVSYRNTQPIYEAGKAPPQADHGVVFDPMRSQGYTLICPPTEHVCEFFGLGRPLDWVMDHIDDNSRIRQKGDTSPVEWDKIRKLITFNSSLGFEALKRGIQVESDPIHSTIGSYIKNAIDPTNRDELFSFVSACQFKLGDKEGIDWLIKYYLSRYISGGTAGNLSPVKFANTLSDARPQPG